MIEVIELIAVEYAITPIIIKHMQKICSSQDLAWISPYPTVVMVVTMKYKPARYCSYIDESR